MEHLDKHRHPTTCRRPTLSRKTGAIEPGNRTQRLSRATAGSSIGAFARPIIAEINLHPRSSAQIAVLPYARSSFTKSCDPEPNKRLECTCKAEATSDRRAASINRRSCGQQPEKPIISCKCPARGGAKRSEKGSAAQTKGCKEMQIDKFATSESELRRDVTPSSGTLLNAAGRPCRHCCCWRRRRQSSGCPTPSRTSRRMGKAWRGRGCDAASTFRGCKTMLPLGDRVRATPD